MDALAKNMARGRPPKPARLRRTQQFHLLLTKAEHTALTRYCLRNNTTASEVLRALLRPLFEDADPAGGSGTRKGGRQ
jgi:hypothetical protein